MFNKSGTVDFMTEINTHNGIREGFFGRWALLICWGVVAGGLSGAITGTCIVPLAGTLFGGLIGALAGAVGGLVLGPITSGLVGRAANPREALYRAEIVTPIGAVVVFLVASQWLHVHYHLGALLISGMLLVTLCVSAAWGGAQLVLSSSSADVRAEIAQHEHGFTVSIWLMIASAAIPPLVGWLATWIHGLL